MKYISFVVPCYNSKNYMKRCIDSLLKGGKDVEIIVVDDGSTDCTGDIADYYALLYPDVIKVIHKENGGHGSGVNAGLEAAEGLYFKVVDSDDWLDEAALEKLLHRIKEFTDNREVAEPDSVPDLILCNYIYDHLDEGKKKTMDYRNVFPVEEMCDWNSIGHFRPSQYLIMHALVYRTEILKECGIRLPEHTFYVDNIFAAKPLPFVKNIFYMDIDLYHYYLGREDQSVNEKVLMSRIDQQIKVTKLVSECVDLKEVEKVYPKLAVYLRRNISIMMAISSIHLLMIHNGEAYNKRKKLWETVRENNRELYFQLKYRTISGLTYLPGPVGDKLTLGGYRIAKRIYQFQ